MDSVESSSTLPSAAGAGRSRLCFVKPLPRNDRIGQLLLPIGGEVTQGPPRPGADAVAARLELAPGG